jgi:endo-1,4-beta-D-glucanase Y
MSICARPLLLSIICVAAACSPANNGADDGGDDDGPIDACPCPDGSGGGGGDGGGGGGDGGGGPDGGSGGCEGMSSGAAQPFGNHGRDYFTGSILPSHLSQAQRDDAVRDFYDAWKADYLKSGCGAGRYYVASGNGRLTVSEAHGYGMLISAFMAGHDPQAKAIFDGLVRYYEDHPSSITPSLMSWAQNSSCQNVDGDNSATDGDLDIAYALLLADKQWSSGGAINYRELAEEIIDGIRAGEVDSGVTYVQLGDWARTGVHGRATRSSDFMPSHFETFAAVTGDTGWRQIRDRSYGIMETLQANFAPQTGLLPDFIEDAATTPNPAYPGFLETNNDGNYAYNACRTPWRIATDYMLNGTARSKTIAQRMNTWIRQRTGNDPGNILPGYNLSGGQSAGNYFDLAFIAPFGVAAMVDASNQTWLNSVWDTTVAGGGAGYYQDSVAMLSLIVMSGNWWSPEAAPCP